MRGRGEKGMVEWNGVGCGCWQATRRWTRILPEILSTRCDCEPVMGAVCPSVYLSVFTWIDGLIHLQSDG